MGLKFKNWNGSACFKNEKSKQTLEKYEQELQNCNVKEHIEKIKSLFQLDHVLNIRNHLNSYFPNVYSFIIILIYN